MFSPLNPGTHVLLKNFMSSNYCFTAVPHRAFSIYIIISRTAPLSCNWIRKHTLYPTRLEWIPRTCFALWGNDKRRGEGKCILSPRKDYLLGRHLGPCTTAVTNGLTAYSVIKAAGFVQWRLQRLFSPLFPLVMCYRQQATFTWSSVMLRKGI